jgi:DNA-binding transcriptional ArsR family regulator
MHASAEDFDLPDRADLAAIAHRFRLLADPTRLTIVCALAQGETNPTCLAELSGLELPAVSQHLAKLRLAGVCDARRDGQRVWYELTDPDVRALVSHVLRGRTSVRRASAKGRR